MSRYDCVVIGAGPAGCVVAARLSENGAEVLLLEARGEDTREGHAAFMEKRKPEFSR